MYKIIGADGKEYGPVTAEQLKQWIADGRVNQQTKVLAEGETEWRTVADLPEFAAVVPGVPPTTIVVSPPGSPATDQVNGPAIGLIVAAILNMLLSVFRIVAAVMGYGGTAMRQTGNAEFDKIIAMSGAISGVMGGVGLLCGIVILLGGIRMRKLRSRSLCLTAAIMALVPCTSPCCFVGIPIGIWALVVLSKPEVKSSFQ